jgi:hypothetical protein
MGTIYKAPKGYDPPDLGKYIKSKNVPQYFKDCEDYIERLQEAIKDSYGDVCPEAGELIDFPVGDGKALYVVARLKPIELIHVDTGDGWHYEYIRRLTAADIRKKIRSNRTLRELFADAKKTRKEEEALTK